MIRKTFLLSVYPHTPINFRNSRVEAIQDGARNSTVLRQSHVTSSNRGLKDIRTQRYVQIYLDFSAVHLNVHIQLCSSVFGHSCCATLTGKKIIITIIITKGNHLIRGTICNIRIIHGNVS